MDNDCIFCKIAGKTIPAKTVFENDELVAFNDINPQAPVHVLIIPKKHIETLNDLSGRDAEIAGKMLMAAKEIAWDLGISKDGYRVVMNCGRSAGQEVFHLHAHLLGGRKFTWPPG